jgi:hypothetical protein
MDSVLWRIPIASGALLALICFLVRAI